MIPTSSEYKTAVYAPSRNVVGRLEFQLVDIKAAEDATPTASAGAEISRLPEIVNTKLDMSGKYATFETDYWDLDGSMSLPPMIDESIYEVGWWSDELSLADSTFASPQLIEIDFGIDHTSAGITLRFDTIANEYASDFTISVYDSLDVLIDSDIVIGNTLSSYAFEEGLEDFRKVVVEITKWKGPFRRARVVEVVFGLIDIYTGDSLINLYVLEELDLISNSLPSNECKYIVDNSDNRFNVLNPEGIYKALQKQQKVIPSYGIEKAPGVTEFIPMGVYYLVEWESEQGALTASFTARDVTDLLQQTKFLETTYVSKSLAFIINDIMSTTEIADYSVDLALDSIIVSGTLPDSSHREALQKVAIAGMAIVYSDRNGSLIIRQLADPISQDYIDFDNVYTEPAIKLQKLINTINVKYGVSTYTLVDPLKPANDPISEVTIDNPLISSLGIAEDVAAWLLVQLNKRFLYDINWRMNPAQEVGDGITVEDVFGINKIITLTRQEFEFNGTLSGKTGGKV